MNYTSFIVKIVGQPKQSFFKDKISVTEIPAKFFPLRNKNSNTTIKLSVWGKLAYDVTKYYKEKDYVIVEGYISLRDLASDSLKKTRDKQVEISVFKIYPFSLNTLKS